METQVTSWTCPVCKSHWPSATQVELWFNHRQANRKHANERCEEVFSRVTGNPPN